MHTYRVEYYRTGAIVAILVFIPLLLVGIFVSIILAIKEIPEWILITAICLLVIFSMILTLIIYKRYGSLPCQVQMSEDGLDIKLLRHSFLYNISHYSSTWSNIQNISTNYDPNHSRRFYQVTFKKPKRTINLIPTEKVANAGEETDFGKTLMDHVEKYNEQHDPSMQIHSRGFYDTFFAKALTFLAFAMAVAVILIKFIAPASIDNWRTMAVLAYSFIWLYSYYMNRPKK